MRKQYLSQKELPVVNQDRYTDKKSNDSYQMQSVKQKNHNNSVMSREDSQSEFKKRNQLNTAQLDKTQKTIIINSTLP